MPMSRNDPAPMPCPVCENASSLALEKDGYPYYECSYCGFLFHRTKADGTSMREFYNSRYWEMERAEADRREREDCFVRAVELIYLSSVPVHNILDFGCGIGITVRVLREKLGLNAVGVDFLADFDETEYLHRCELDGLLEKYPPGYFDAIYSIEVLEHLENPRQIIKTLGTLLKPGGRLLINTSTREYIDEHDPEQTYIDPSRRGHISIYSLKSLNELALTIGYSAAFMGDRK